jgi:chromosomal replication initiation ATPase DnaA
LSLNKIGQIFGRDHTTALSNVRRHRFEADHEAK